jgi:3-polyprenyl-4-hydroxybenzoate decarboxylase
MALGSRWQPFTETYIFEEARGMPLDPSTVERYKSSKIVIDATKQWPEEGGPEKFPELNRTLLEELAPESFELVAQKWGDVITRKLTTFN